MKKGFLFWFFFGLTNLVFGQVWDAVKVGEIDTDSIIKGEVTIWVKPTASEWTYEGVMTVGDLWSIDPEQPFNVIGCEGGNYGSINPSLGIEFSLIWSDNPEPDTKKLIILSFGV